MSSVEQHLDVAVFPLTDAVLFPGVTLALSIFEDRYKAMLQDIQKKKLPLAVCLVIPQNDKEFLMNTICGAGRVQVQERFPDGRHEILVHGTQRVRLFDVIQEEPYFVMKAECLENQTLLALSFKQSFEDFQGLIKTWMFLNPKFPEHMALVFDEFKTFGELADFFVFHFIEDPKQKQTYLDCTNPIQRAEKLATYLETDLLRLSRKLARKKKFLLYH